MNLQEFEKIEMTKDELEATKMFAESLYRGGKMKRGETKDEFFHRVCETIYKNFK